MSLPIKLLTGMVFAGLAATGIGLASTGKPYGTALFTVHKLTALALVVLAAILLRSALKLPGAASLTSFLVLESASVLTLFATGALMSLGKRFVVPLPAIHTAATIATIVAFVLIAGFLARQS